MFAVVAEIHTEVVIAIGKTSGSTHMDVIERCDYWRIEHVQAVDGSAWWINMGVLLFL